jgi:hypothetical protein
MTVQLLRRARCVQTDYNKWDKIVAALSDDEDAAPAAAPLPPPRADPDASVGVGAALTGECTQTCLERRAQRSSGASGAATMPRCPAHNTER